MGISLVFIFVFAYQRPPILVAWVDMGNPLFSLVFIFVFAYQRPPILVAWVDMGNPLFVKGSCPSEKF